MKTAFDLLKQTFQEWNEDKAARLAAALAYYATFSIAPLLVLLIAGVGLIFGRSTAQSQIMGQIAGVVGPAGASLIEDMVRSASRPQTGIPATIIGIVTLLVGATAVFAQLQDALNTIWGVMPRPGRGIWSTVRDRLWGFAMLLAIGLLLLLFLVASTTLSALDAAGVHVVAAASAALPIANQIVTLVLATALFGLIFKILPDVWLGWSDVWIGAAFTGVLFTIGKFLLGLYLGRSGVSSAYGAAGSLVVILLWIYYSAQILFLGAEFVQVYARRYGRRLQPARGAIWMSPEVRAAQGIPTRDQAMAAAAAQPEASRKAMAAGPARASVGLLAASTTPSARRDPGRGVSAAAMVGSLLLVAVVAVRAAFRRV